MLSRSRAMACLVFLCSTLAPAQMGWTVCPTGTTLRLDAVCCIDQSTPWCCAFEGTVGNSTNGGADWSVRVIDSTCSFSDICFTTTGAGYACGYDTKTYRAKLYGTTNGGTGWHLLSTSDPYTGYITLCFTSPTVGYLGMHIGTNGNILKTTNAGQSWIPGSGTGYIRSIRFSGARRGLAVGQGGVVYRTTDEGGTWVQKFQLPNAPVYDFFTVFLADSLTAYAAGDRGYLYKSTDGGETWKSSFDNTLFKRRFTSLWFMNPLTGLAVGDSGTIIRTTNGGVSWQLIPSHTSEYLSGVVFANTSVGYVAGHNGVVLKTTNGGVVWVNERKENVPAVVELYQNFPNPFNGISDIGFHISEFTDVKLQVFDLLGHIVATLVDERKAPGDHLVQFDAGRLASGSYICRLRAGSSVQSRKMVLAR